MLSAKCIWHTNYTKYIILLAYRTQNGFSYCTLQINITITNIHTFTKL